MNVGSVDFSPYGGVPKEYDRGPSPKDEPEHLAPGEIRPSAAQAKFLNSDARYRGYVGGVGAGKTFASLLAALKASEVAERGMLVAPSYTMVQDILIPEMEQLAEKTEAGIKDFRYSPPPKITLGNGSEILFRSADKPQKLRGPNLGFFGIDEAAFVSREVWDVLIGRLRLPPEQGWITTTPQGYNWVYDVFVDEHDESKYWVQAPTDTAHWLSETYLEDLKKSYSEEQRRQEIQGEFITRSGGAFQWDDIIHKEAPEDLHTVIVGVDPAGGGKDEIGIVTCGRKEEEYWVLDDRSCKGRPSKWARRAKAAFEEYGADKIVVERQYGGDMVSEVLQSQGPAVPVDDVPALQGKRLRADPVIAKYEQGQVYHARKLEELEKQMTSWDPDSDRSSPDRIEAMVYSVRALIKEGPRVESEVMFV